jgi:PAS domain S-box-containing protein
MTAVGNDLAGPGVTSAESRLLDALGDAVIITDPQGQIASWNRGAEELYGWTADEAVGRNIIDVTPSELSRPQAEEILGQLARGEAWQGQFLLRRRDGSTFVARVSDAPLLDAEGNLRGIIGVSQDVGAVDGAVRHLACLAEASRILGASLEYERTLQDVVRVLVPVFADVCSVFVVEPSGLRRVADAAIDTETERVFHALRGAPAPAAVAPVFADVMRTQRAHLIDDLGRYLADANVASDDAYAQMIQRIQVTAAIVAPVMVRGRAIGALTLGVLRRTGRKFDAADARFADELAHRVGLAIDNARLYGTAEAARRALEQRERTLLEERRTFETLYRIGTSLAKELDERTLIQLVTDEATALTGASFGAFHFDVTSDPHGPLVALTFRGGGVLRSDDIRVDARLAAAEGAAVALPFASYLGVPVITRSGEVLAALVFAHEETAHFTAEHERLVVGMAGQAAIALENARLYSQLRTSEANAKGAFEVAREAEQRKDEFLAMLGHELRNPLAPIVTALELMRMRGDTSRESQIIERQVDHLTRLVDDLLDVARITRGKIELKRQRVEVAAIVARAIEIASPLIEQRSHHLRVDVPATGLAVYGDPTRLAQIVSNLLANAAKYTDPGGHIDVHASRDDDLITIRVRDDGTGIDAPVLARIFEPFVQSPQTPDRAQGGLGIGLTLARSLVAMHDGHVEATSEGLGKGTELVVTLPLAGSVRSADALGPAPRAVTVPARGEALRVLVVDDNNDAVEMLAEALRALGHTVVTAEDGPSALRASAEFHPEVAVLDIGLPVMDGFELAERLRASECPPARLIAVTGYGQDEDRARAKDAGFGVHLVKPIDLRALDKAIRAAGSAPMRAPPAT